MLIHRTNKGTNEKGRSATRMRTLLGDAEVTVNKNQLSRIQNIHSKRVQLYRKMKHTN